MACCTGGSNALWINNSIVGLKDRQEKILSCLVEQKSVVQSSFLFFSLCFLYKEKLAGIVNFLCTSQILVLVFQLSRFVDGPYAWLYDSSWWLKNKYESLNWRRSASHSAETRSSVAVHAHAWWFEQTATARYEVQWLVTLNSNACTWQRLM